MYNQELEQLIEIAIKDGHLTEKEIRVLKNKANEYGIDEDELEMVLDARILDIKQKTKAAMPKSNKQGEVNKCPACGEIIPFLVGVCPTCGHTFDLTQTDVELIEKLERDCQTLTNIKYPAWPIILSLNIILLTISLICGIMDICMDDDFGPGWIITCILFYGNLFISVPIASTCRQDSKDTGKLAAAKLDKYVFDIRSKIKSTKLVYANNKLVMARLDDLEEYVKENLTARKNRTKTIITIGIVVAVILLIIGILMGL